MRICVIVGTLRSGCVQGVKRQAALKREYSENNRERKRLIRTVHQEKNVTVTRIVRFWCHCFSISIDIEMSAGAMDQQPAIMLTMGKEVLSGKDKQGAFEAILDNLMDQGALAGFGAYVFTLHVIQQKQIEGVSAQFVGKVIIEEGAGTPGPTDFGRGNGALQPATNSPYFRILRDKSSAAAAASETGRRSVSGRKSMSMLVEARMTR
jgi:hypothetical protein